MKSEAPSRRASSSAPVAAVALFWTGVVAAGVFGFLSVTSSSEQLSTMEQFAPLTSALMIVGGALWYFVHRLRSK